MLLDDLRLEGPVAIPWHFDRHRPKASLEGLGRLPIARVAALVTGRLVLLVADMLGQLRRHRPLQQLLRQLLQQAVLANDVFGLFVVFQQIVNELVVYGHLSPSPNLNRLSCSMTIYTKLFIPSSLWVNRMNALRIR